MRFRQDVGAKTLLGSRQLTALPPAKIAALPLLSRFWASNCATVVDVVEAAWMPITK